MRCNVLCIILVLFLCACGTSKSVVKETVVASTDTSKTTVKSAETSINARSASSATQSGNYSSDIKETSQRADTSLVVAISETTWYDTTHIDSIGVTPVAKREVKTMVRRNGVSEVSMKSGNAVASSFAKSEMADTLAETMNETSSTSSQTSVREQRQSNVHKSVSETRQVKYIAMLLYGSAAVLLAVVIVFVVYKIRHRIK